MKSRRVMRASLCHAQPNRHPNRPGKDYSGSGCLGAANNAYVQTLADIQANGIDGMRTAFADYQIVGGAAGTYAVYIGEVWRLVVLGRYGAVAQSL